MHDATPRTFVVHVLSLFERGILDSTSIRFLFDLGLVPKAEGVNVSGDAAVGGACDTGAKEHSNRDEATTNPSTNEECGCERNNDGDQGAIIPYNPHSIQHHPWARYLPPPPLATCKQSNPPTNGCKAKQKNNLAHRQKEASAIRKHLERHESFDSSTQSTVFGSASAGMIPGFASAPPSLSTMNGWNRTNSSATQNTLTSTEESFNAAPRNAQNVSVPKQSTQLSNLPTTTSSWSVEQHPLSLSRYQREFHQIALLATGSFGSVYHAIHKLEHRPYAVKCVSFSTTGYYANTLALVIREVRCLAQLDHPNCVRYYTSWLEPSWMTGEQNLNNNFDEDEYLDGKASEDDRRRPKLLTDIERVINGINGSEEIPHSVEQLEAILYGNNEDTNDGFDWASSSGSQIKEQSAFSFNRTEEKNGNWANLTSHKTNFQSMLSTSSGGNGHDSDVSVWTEDLNGGGDSYEAQWDSQSSSFAREEGGLTDTTDSFHCVHSQMKNCKRQESLELAELPKPNVNGPNYQYQSGGRVDGNHKGSPKHQSSSSTASSYKYQICLFIQMQLCHPTTLADWIKQRNNECDQFDAEERQARARPAFEVFRSIVNGLSHVHSKGIIHRDLKPAVSVIW